MVIPLSWFIEMKNKNYFTFSHFVQTGTWPIAATGLSSVQTIMA